MKKMLVLFLFLTHFCFANENPQFSGNIFMIGDSHTGAFTGLTGVLKHIVILGIRGVKPGHPGTMYVTGRDHAENITLDPRINDLMDGDATLFSFGHVDANWLIWKQVNIKHRDLDETIEILVNNYLDAILGITNKNTIKIIYNVTPPSNNKYSPVYIGTLKERIAYSRKINTVLARECKKRNLEFLDIYEDFCDKMGMLRVELSDGNHHINQSYNGVLLRKLWHILNKYK